MVEARAKSTSRKSGLAAVVLGLCLAHAAFAPTIADAAPIPFSHQSLSYDLQEEALSTFLERLFADESINVDISNGVRQQTGTLNGPRRGSAAEIFRSVQASYRLGAYYDGSTVHVFRRDELVSRFFVVPPEQAPSFMATVRQLDMNNEFNTVRVTPDTGLVSVSGAPQFVEQVAQIGEAIGQRRTPVATVFRFFPLKYAWASDRSFVVGNRQVTIPGVATVLQQLLEEGGAIGGSAGGFSAPGDTVLPATAQSLNGQGLAAQGNPQASGGARYLGTDGNGGLRMMQSENRPAQSAAPRMTAFTGASGARIVADPYRNAVIVRDAPERIALYEDLVHSLDVETQIMEIQATIIDVDTDKLRQLGVEWRYGSKKTEAVLGNAEGSKDDFVNAMLSGNIASLGQVPGFQLGAIIGDSSKFIARVNALQTEGAMRVVSRPQVVTINDIEATIESSRQLYIPVNGAFQVDLFNVYAGTVLRVTPHLINDQDRERIRMLITVEDGDVKLTSQQVTNNQINQIPEVVRNAVSTQAVIDGGQSLLLGGLIRDSGTTTVTKVPILGDIPLLGELFKTRSRQAERTERLFLISPRVLDSSRPQVLPTAIPELNAPAGSPLSMPVPPTLPPLPPPGWPAQPLPPPQQPLQPSAMPRPQSSMPMAPPPPLPTEPAPPTIEPSPVPTVAPQALRKDAVKVVPVVTEVADLPTLESPATQLGGNAASDTPVAPAASPSMVAMATTEQPMAPPMPTPAPSPSEVAVAPQPERFRAKPARGLKMRFDASTTTSSVALLQQGALLQPTGQAKTDANGREWIEVIGDNEANEATVGWVAREFVEPEGTPLAMNDVVPVAGSRRQPVPQNPVEGVSP